MSKDNKSKKDNINEGNYDEEMTVTLDLDDGTSVTCAIITILTVQEKDYIVLLPVDEDEENEDGEVWFYQYVEDPDNEDADPELIFIESDEEYEIVAERFDEILDEEEFGDDEEN